MEQTHCCFAILVKITSMCLLHDKFSSKLTPRNLQLFTWLIFTEFIESVNIVFRKFMGFLLENRK